MNSSRPTFKGSPCSSTCAMAAPCFSQSLELFSLAHRTGPRRLEEPPMGRTASAVLSPDAAWQVIDRERSGVADLLDDLSDDEGGQPSLCAGWRVRDVAAHLALAHTGPVRAAVELARAAGRFDVMIRDTALRHAQAPPRQLVDEL